MYNNNIIGKDLEAHSLCHDIYEQHGVHGYQSLDMGRVVHASTVTALSLMGSSHSYK